MTFFIKILSVILEYGMILCLILFVIKSMNYLFSDIRKKSRNLKRREEQNNSKISDFRQNKKQWKQN